MASPRTVVGCSPCHFSATWSQHEPTAPMLPNATRADHYSAQFSSIGLDAMVRGLPNADLPSNGDQSHACSMARTHNQGWTTKALQAYPPLQDMDYARVRNQTALAELCSAAVTQAQSYVLSAYPPSQHCKAGTEPMQQKKTVRDGGELSAERLQRAYKRRHPQSRSSEARVSVVA